MVRVTPGVHLGGWICHSNEVENQWFLTTFKYVKMFLTKMPLYTFGGVNYSHNAL